MIRAQTMEDAAAGLLPIVRARLALDLAALVVDGSDTIIGYVLRQSAVEKHVSSPSLKGASFNECPFLHALPDPAVHQHQMVVAKGGGAWSLSLVVGRARSKGRFAMPERGYLEHLQLLLGALAERILFADEREVEGHRTLLSAGETRVARLVSAGLRNVEIAGELHLSPHTVRTHVYNIFKKLGVRNRAALARLIAVATTR